VNPGGAVEFEFQKPPLLELVGVIEPPPPPFIKKSPELVGKAPTIFVANI
jgi:hypothetical protein